LNDTDSSASVIGLGKLGAPLLATLASKGIRAVGVDREPEPVRAILAGRPPVAEPGLRARIEAGRACLDATTDTKDAVLRTDLSFLVLPTPSEAGGRFTNRFLLDSIEEIGSALREKESYHVVNITSTVLPGSTNGVLREALEHASGRAVGVDVGLCYNPEFIALGSVIRDILRPDFILIGESDARAGDLLAALYRRLCDEEPPIYRMNHVNAEIAKLAVNTFVTTKISYANMLAELCDALPGADVEAVTGAVGADARIGGKYLRGSMAYGGPCFPRDNKALAALARDLGVRCDIAEATDRINDHQSERLVDLVRRRASKRARVGILGLAYKPETPVVEESPGLHLAEALVREGYEVTVYDPIALSGAMAHFEARRVAVTAAGSAAEVMQSVDVAVITVALPEFEKLPLVAVGRKSPTPLVIDPWRVLSRANRGDGLEIIHLGVG